MVRFQSKMTDALHHVVAKPSFLKMLPRKLERPMLLLSFVWFLVIITELVTGTSLLLLSLGTVLWALFVIYFGLRLAIVPKRVMFLKRNWLFVRGTKIFEGAVCELNQGISAWGFGGKVF